MYYRQHVKAVSGWLSDGADETLALAQYLNRFVGRLVLSE